MWLGLRRLNMHHSIHKTERDCHTQTLWFYSSEQQYKQTSSRPNYLIGHYQYGMKAEDNISGCFRGTESGFGNSITFNFSNYSESARIQVNIQLGSDKSIESVERTKYPLNFGY